MQLTEINWFEIWYTWFGKICTLSTFERKEKQQQHNRIRNMYVLCAVKHKQTLCIWTCLDELNERKNVRTNRIQSESVLHRCCWSFNVLIQTGRVVCWWQRIFIRFDMWIFGCCVRHTFSSFDSRSQTHSIWIPMNWMESERTPNHFPWQHWHCTFSETLISGSVCALYTRYHLLLCLLFHEANERASKIERKREKWLRVCTI